MLKSTSWIEWKKELFIILQEALTELARVYNHVKDENELNRRLAILIRKHKMIWEKDNNKNIIGSCIYHAYNQPDIQEIKKTSRENKIPEFLWEFSDYQNDITRDFCIECKRLCEDENIFSRRYVVNGIQRYISSEWKYGFKAQSGLIIGYFQENKHEIYFNKINQHCSTRNIPALIIVKEFEKTKIFILKHSFKRKFPISPFLLEHMWVDLR